MKVKRIQSELDVLWDFVTIGGDNKDEVLAEGRRIADEVDGQARWLEPRYVVGANHRWLMVGEVRRPH
jgi:hypothetical protein